MTETPKSGRLHIVLVGERNSGKSSLMNALAGQQVSIVSEVPGTTTDEVSKAIELPGLGPCLLVDTAGLGDAGAVGEKRVKRTLEVLRGADIVLALVDAGTGRLPEIPPVSVPVIRVVNKCDLPHEDISGKVPAMEVSAISGKGIPELIDAIREAIPEDWNAPLLTEGVVNDRDLVLLVMPQDSQAPKGRLILPQQQTLRELLDRGCRVVCCTTARLNETLASLKDLPDAVITDSQAFKAVHDILPEGVTLTSFSILQAAAKGDIDCFREGAKVIDRLDEGSRILIAEACTHVPAGEDIGRVKLPRLLRKKAGEGLQIDVVSGRDWPEDLTPYNLVIHCGACMFNRRYVLSRIAQARLQGVPMTNYGIAIAHIDNIPY